MNKRIILGIVALLLIVIGAYFLFTSRGAFDTPADFSARYENTEFGYSIAYPTSLTYREYALGNVVFGTEEGEVMNGVAEVRIITPTGEAGQSFDDAVAAELMMLCAADGPNATFSCTGVEQVQPFTTSDGHAGRVLYLRGELTDFTTQETTVMGKGPYFVIPTSTGATASRAIVVHPPLNIGADEADSETIRRMAESLTLSDVRIVSADSVEEYIRTNISTLSPASAVLGGTFYVIEIEAADGKGIVTYEDGHIVLTADFTYDTTSAEPRITSFVIRDIP